jgi:alpha-1,3-mannosyltransferase
MKILHIVRQYPPSIGGLESYVRSMVRHLEQAGHSCTVLTLDRLFHGDQAVLPRLETIDGIPVHRVGFWGRQRFFIPRITPSFFRRFDIVHVHNTDVFFDYVALYGWLTRRPVFATTHGGFFHTKTFSLIKTLYFNLITRLSCKPYRALFAISENDYKTFHGLNKNLLLQPNAIEPLGAYIAEGRDFIYLGRLAKHKNVAQLIETHALLVRQHGVDGILHIVGPEWDVTQAELIALAEKLDISSHVKVHGVIEDEALQTLLHACGFYVSASLYEGFGMSMLEGMSIGLIPYVHPNESFKTLIAQGGVGLCTDFTDPARAASDIAAGLKQAGTEDRKKAQAFARTFSWDELTANTVKEYKKALP